MSELDDFFDEAELDSTTLIEVRRVRLESLMQCTVLWDDEATLDAIMYGPMDDQTYHHLNLRLIAHLDRPDSRGRWTQTQMARFIKSFTHETNY
jgi:hypothetical protein